MNPNKYYHNNYKKIMGIDETRTASQKILDRVIGNIIPTKSYESNNKPQKKVKQEQSNTISHKQVLDKLLKNIQNNVNALKIIKPLNILKKCMNDASFVNNQEVNQMQNWGRIMFGLIDIEERIVGNVCQRNQVTQCLVEIFGVLMQVFMKFQQKYEIREVKYQDKEQKQVKQESIVQQKYMKNLQNRHQNLLPQNVIKQQSFLLQLLNINKLYLLYYKLYTDDSFIFNKLLLQFKSEYFTHYKNLTTTQSTPTQLQSYIQKLLLKMFNLPHDKYKWVKQSLLTFYKEFNIEYKQVLEQQFLQRYLKEYNLFLNNSRSNQKSYSENNSLNGTSKGGKIAVVEVVSNDGLDKWTSKQ